MEVIWNENGNRSPILLKRQARWQGIKVFHHDVLSGRMKEFVPNVHEFNITLAGQMRVEKQTSGGKTLVKYSNPSNLCITPSGQPFKAFWEDRVENLAVLIKPDFVERIALENNFSTGFEITEIYREEDPLVQQIALTFLNEINEGESANKLYLDTLSQSLVIHLLKNYTNSKFNSPEKKGGLSGYKLRRVKEFIKDNVEEDLSLAEIAEVAGLSQFHFARAFRKSTGLTPQKYLMTQRIERAKILLTNKDLPIVEVSLQTGFKNQSHFTALFRKFTKLTPKNWRELKHT